MQMFEFKQLKKACKHNVEGEQYKIAVLGNSSTQFLSKAIEGYGKISSLNISVYDGEYNQIDFLLRDEKSSIYLYKPDDVVIYLSSEKLYEEYLLLEDTLKDCFVEQYAKHIENYWHLISEKLKARIIQFNFTEIEDKAFGNFSAKVRASFVYQIRKLNFMLETMMEDRSDVFPVDLLSLQIRLGSSVFFDANLYYDSKMSISLEALPYVAKEVISVKKALIGQTKKCIILDLDNTLWGGVIGDDGLDGIQVGEYGIGPVYTNLQLYFKQLEEAGIILCVCSKNDEEVAKEPFEKLDEMVLRLSDFAVFVANWKNKADNIRVIQKTLNIGFDSMVFVDDSAFERDLVRSELPEIEVAELPNNPAEYLAFLQSQNYFEVASISEENKNRTRQYQEEYERLKQRENYSSIADYLKSLEMKATIRKIEPRVYNRVSQLTQRSNQFNLRTIRYTPKEIEDIAEKKENQAFYVELKDCHGDYGLVSVVILKKVDNKCYFFDTWLMSCRVLSRGCEEYIMNWIADHMKKIGITRLIGEYIPTLKNGMVKNLLPRMGFLQMGGNKYELELTNYKNKDTFITEE